MPTNISALTATDLTAPSDITQDVNSGGTTYTVWYKYTAVSGDNVMGIYAYGDGVAYYVNTKIYLGPAAAPVGYLEFTTPPILFDAPGQFPVTPGETYYFEFISVDGDVPDAILNLSFGRGPNGSVDVGDIIINDENEGFPLVIVDPTDASPKGFVQDIANGEHGAIFLNGDYLCLEDTDDNEVVIYQNMIETARITWPHAPAAFASVSSNRTTKFYIGNQGAFPATAAFVRRVDTSGAFDAPTWTLPTYGLLGMAPALDDSILYWGRLVAGDPVRRYDLVNDVALSDLFVGIPNYYVAIDMFVLQDGTILAGFLKSGAVANPSFIVKQFNAAGTVLNTYNFNTGTVTSHRVAIGEDDPDSFWVKIHQSGGAVEYQHVDIATGTILDTINSYEFGSGKSNHTYAKTPGTQFGQAPSCPFFIASSAFSPSGPAGLFKIVTSKRTDHNGTVDVKIPNPTFRTSLLP